MGLFSRKTDVVKPAFFSRENLQSLGFLVLVVLAFRWSVGAPYHVPTPSMEPTIKVGDRLVANHLAYQFRIPFTDIIPFQWGVPEVGEVIVFDSQTESGINMVKRVVATSGDKVQVLNDRLFVNGTMMEQTIAEDASILTDITDAKEFKTLYFEQLGSLKHWIIHDQRILNMQQESKFPSDGSVFAIPEGHVFVMGDNRHNSSDSRVWGTVPIADVYGRAELVIWSMYFRDVASWMPSFRFQRFFSYIL